jgi:Icc-related predicted phosphoesterase
MITATELKLFVCSDLHIDFMSKEELNQFTFPAADVYLIAGDTMNGVKQPLCQWVIDKTHGKPTYLIPGNHEYYGLRRDKALRRFTQYFETTPVQVLLDSHAEIAPCLSLYGTDLWTDMALYNDVGRVSSLARSKMNDFKAITFKSGTYFSKLNPKNTIAWHIEAKNLIRSFSEETNNQFILMTHHGLFKECLLLNDDGTRGKDELDPVYTSDGQSFFESLPNKPILCINGHLHHKNHSQVVGIPIYANPRGYKGKLTSSLISAKFENNRWTLSFRCSNPDIIWQ